MSADSLKGHRILLTRSVEDNRAWSELLRARGAEPFTLACITTAPPPDEERAATDLVSALEQSHRDDWLVLSSARAVKAVARFWRSSSPAPAAGDAEDAGEDRTARARPLPRDLAIACVGPRTALAAAELLGRVDRIAPLGTGRSLGAELAASLPRSARVLVAGAQEGRIDVEEVLRPAGIDVRRIAVYATRPVTRDEPPLRLRDLALDAIFLASPSAVRGLANQARLDRDALGDPLVVTIGPTTSAAARERGLSVDAEARARGLDGMCRAYRERRELGAPPPEPSDSPESPGPPTQSNDA